MTTMPRRHIGPFEVSAIGLGCMNLSHAVYGKIPPPEVAEQVLLRALDLGIDFFDTAAIYGFGANEELLGRVLKPYRQRIILASKCGITDVDGKRVIDGRPETLRRTCEKALQRLQTEVIDLYYLHRLDFKVPIEESIGALSDLVRAGKIRSIGVSEVSASTLRRAHLVHPIAALQSEYSLWSREAEIATLATCQELGVAFVAFSPIARGFLGGKVTDPTRPFGPGDVRLNMPRFSPDHNTRNLALLDAYRRVAAEVGCTMAQLALAWVLAKGENIVPIQGTTKIEHLEVNAGAVQYRLTPLIVDRLDALINERTVSGRRYSDATLREIDTEIFN